jgi:uncharacterized protein (DUF2235 family)
MQPAKNIALFIDGTWNEPSKNEDTNVRKLFHASRFEVTGASPQVTYYLPGVGTDIKQSHPGMPVGLYGGDLSFKAHLDRETPVSAPVLRSLVGGSFGAGTAARIKEAYGFLSYEYDRDRGDKVFVFGFSRGAFAARSLAGFVSRVGTLLREKLDLIEAAYRIYEDGTDPADTALRDFLLEFTGKAMIRSIEDREALPIHLLGVWDTVGALGLPGRLRKFTARHTEYHQTEVPPTVLAARQALALHELRKPFEPLLWSNRNRHPGLLQVWFPGAHADVGGGYHNDESGLSDNALRWMSTQAIGIGLQLEPHTWWMDGSTGKPVLHHEIRKWFYPLHPSVRPQLQRLVDAPDFRAMDNALFFHDSVGLHLRDRAARQYDFRRSGVNDRLAEADELAMRLFVRSRLLGLAPMR